MRANFQAALPNRWQVLGIICLLVLWEAFAWYVYLQNPERANIIFPRIEQIITVSFPEFATYYGFERGLLGYRSDSRLAFLVLLENSLITIRRVVTGVVLGVGLGIGIGLLAGWSRWVRDVILPPVLLLRTIPILALIPLFLFWFGGREIGILIYIVFAVFSMMIINTLEAIRNVPAVYHDYARCMGASPWQVYYTVVVPYYYAFPTGRHPGYHRCLLGNHISRRVAGHQLWFGLADDSVGKVSHDRAYDRNCRSVCPLLNDPKPPFLKKYRLGDTMASPGSMSKHLAEDLAKTRVLPYRPSRDNSGPKSKDLALDLGNNRMDSPMPLPFPTGIEPTGVSIRSM